MVIQSPCMVGQSLCCTGVTAQPALSPTWQEINCKAGVWFCKGDMLVATESTSTSAGVQMFVLCEGFNPNYPFLYRRCSVDGLLQSFEILSLKELRVFHFWFIHSCLKVSLAPICIFVAYLKSMCLSPAVVPLEKDPAACWLFCTVPEQKWQTGPESGYVGNRAFTSPSSQRLGTCFCHEIQINKLICESESGSVLFTPFESQVGNF